MALLKIRGTLRGFFETRIPPGVDVGPCRDLTVKLIADLDDWAATYSTLTKVSGRTCDTVASSADLHVTNQYGVRPGLPDPPMTPTPLNYVATRLMLNMLMHKISTQSNTPPATPGSADLSYLSEAIQCAEAIVDGAVELEKARTPRSDLLLHIAPVVCVACAAPTQELGNEAGELMQRWTTTIAGCAVVWQHT